MGRHGYIYDIKILDNHFIKIDIRNVNSVAHF